MLIFPFINCLFHELNHLLLQDCVLVLSLSVIIQTFFILMFSIKMGIQILIIFKYFTTEMTLINILLQMFFILICYLLRFRKMLFRLLVLIF